MLEHKQRQTRINAKVRAFLSHLVFDGWSVAKSAEACGWTKDWGYRLLRREDVLALRRDMMQVLRTSEGARTIARVRDLADDASSEHVRMAALEWLGGLDGIAPVAKSEITHRHEGHVPGLTIVFASAPPADAPQVVDAKARPAPALPAPVPHPAFASSGGAEDVEKRRRKSGGGNERMDLWEPMLERAMPPR